MASDDSFEGLLRAVARAPDRAVLTPGVQLGAYRIERFLGRGGMGEVFVAEDTRLRRSVALKVLPEDFSADPERRARFEREARAAAAVTHPHIATIYEVGEAEGRVFLAMELIEGQTLRQRIASGALPIPESIRIARQVARGLGRAHERGVVHRDLKPDNIMLTVEGEVKILDFGLAKLEDGEPAGDETTAPDVSRTGQVMGTPGYMSPEQAAGRELDARTDLFSLGVVLYEMVTGRRPFAGASPMEVIIALSRDEPEPPSRHNPAVSEALEAVIARCLRKAPGDRYGSARDLDAALTQLEEAPISSSSGLRWPRGRRARWAWAAMPVVALGAVLAVRALGDRTPLAGPDSVLACPPLEASGVEAPTGWLGAAASTMVCDRATIALGGRQARTRIPAQLLDLPIQLVDDFPDDPFSAPEARARAISAARARGDAWLDGAVHFDHGRFTVSLVIRNRRDRELAVGTGEDRLLYKAVQAAMLPLVASGALPRAEAIHPTVQPWYDTRDIDAAMAVRDSDLAVDTREGRALPEDLRPVVERASAFSMKGHFEVLVDLLEHPGTQRTVQVQRATPGAFVLTATAAGSLDPKVDKGALADEAHARFEKETDHEGRSMFAVAEGQMALALGDVTRATMASLRAVEEDPRNYVAWRMLAFAELYQPNAQVAARAFTAWVPENGDAWNVLGVAVKQDKAAAARVGRRALVLAPDAPVLATNLATILLELDRPAEVRAIAARVSAGRPEMAAAAEVMLAQADFYQGRLAAAYERASGFLAKLPLAGAIFSSSVTMLFTGLQVALTLDRQAELADAFAKRFVLPSPHHLDTSDNWGRYTVAFGCALASPPVVRACLDRLRQLSAEHVFSTFDTPGTLELIDGVEAIQHGDRARAVSALRRANGPDAWLRAVLADRLGSDDLVELLDAPDLRPGAPPTAAQAWARAARRAQRKGDLGAARTWAKKAVDVWDTADVAVPALAELRAIVSAK